MKADEGPLAFPLLLVSPLLSLILSISFSSLLLFHLLHLLHLLFLYLGLKCSYRLHCSLSFIVWISQLSLNFSIRVLLSASSPPNADVSLLKHLPFPQLLLLALAGAPPLPPSLLYLSSFFHSSWMVLPLSIRAEIQFRSSSSSAFCAFCSSDGELPLPYLCPPQIEGLGQLFLLVSRWFYHEATAYLEPRWVRTMLRDMRKIIKVVYSLCGSPKLLSG